MTEGRGAPWVNSTASFTGRVVCRRPVWAREDGQLCPSTVQAHPGAGDPGRAAGRSVGAPD
eukprot:8774137-Heterocapsa_arctica.AAC.1